MLLSTCLFVEVTHLSLNDAKAEEEDSNGKQRI